MNGGYVYMMTNVHHTVLYIGVTSDLRNRVTEHVNHYFKDSFTDKYNATKLVYYERFNNIESAIAREKQLKGWTRKKKEVLINNLNPEWMDLSSS